MPRGASSNSTRPCSGNRTARELYHHLGFRTYGVEPRGIKVGERYFDQELLVLMLDGSRPW